MSDAHSARKHALLRVAGVLGLVCLVLLLLGNAFAQPSPGFSDATLTADQVMRQVNLRKRGSASQARLEMLLSGSRAEFRKQIIADRKQFDTGYRTAYWITAPEHENGIGLLISEDAPQRGMWMHFPAVQQTIHVVSRGLPALASDFSCEDLLAEVPLSDYAFRIIGRDVVDGFDTFRVEMKPKNDQLRSELGFTNSIGWIRDDIWMIVRADYLDEAGVAFKSFTAGDIEQIQGIWTARKLVMANHRARHSTEVRTIDINYSARLAEEIFTPARFGSGLVAPSR